MTEATQRTSDSGVSIWLDDLSRSRIESGSLQDLIANKNVVGVTTNPSIFQKALHEVGPYDPQLKELGKVDVETAVRELTTTDVRNATDIFREVAEKSDFVDGRVSIEVDPRLAHETEATEKQAEELWAKVNRPNAMIKIPANPRRPAGNHRNPGQGHLRERHPDLLPGALRAGHRRLHRGHRPG
jgi:tal_mycobact: transaldolase